MKVKLKFKKDLFKTKPVLVGVVLALILLIIIGLATVYYFTYGKDAQIPEDRRDITGPAVKAVPEPAGGDPALVTSYYQQALSAWKAGDKEKAKSLAQKGLDVNEQLTEAQKSQVPDQMNTIYNLFYITEGSYRE